MKPAVATPVSSDPDIQLFDRMPDSNSNSSGAASDSEGLAPPAGLTRFARRDWLRERLRERSLTTVSPEEIQAHFDGMPEHYWDAILESELVWGLETIHGCLSRMTSPAASSAAPFVDWRHATDSSTARVMLCTWDRHGLLAKAAAAFSAARLNIVRANVYTRADRLVLDVFQVKSADGSSEVGATRIQEMNFLLEGALSEPPRFASVWACSRHKYLSQPASRLPEITFDNVSDAQATIVRVEAADRLGLLYDLLQSMADNDLEIKEARITTERGTAQDELRVTDRKGSKLGSGDVLEALRARLEAALVVAD